MWIISDSVLSIDTLTLAEQSHRKLLWVLPNCVRNNGFIEFTALLWMPQIAWRASLACRWQTTRGLHKSVSGYPKCHVPASTNFDSKPSVGVSEWYAKKTQIGQVNYRPSWYYQSFIYSPTDAPVSCLKNRIKTYIKFHTKTAPTCFGVTVTPSSGSTLICAY